MTTYTTIADTDIDQDSPITASLMTALRNNPIAITEGSTGAPQIQTAAIADEAITRDKLAALSGGSLVYITKQTITATVATVDFTTGIDSTFDHYVLFFNNVAQSGVTTNHIRVSDDSGATWISTGYSGLLLECTTTGTTSSLSSSDYVELGSQGRLTGFLYLTNLTVGGAITRMFGNVGDTTDYNIVAGTAASGLHNGIRLDNTASSFTSGEIVLYGLYEG